MDKSKVYYTNFHTTFSENLPQKLKRLIKTAGMEQIDFQNKYAAIKIHFGELGNLSFLRPNYAKVVADLVRENGGKPFFCNTASGGICLGKLVVFRYGNRNILLFRITPHQIFYLSLKLFISEFKDLKR